MMTKFLGRLLKDGIDLSHEVSLPEQKFRLNKEFKVQGKVKISLLQAVEAPRVARSYGSHIT
jgi:hypothetical protein